MSKSTSRHIAADKSALSQNTDTSSASVDASVSNTPTPRRDQKKIPLVIKIGASLIALIILGSAGYLIWRHLTGAAQAKEQISAAIASVSESDAAIVPLNNTITSDLGSKTSDELTKIKEAAKKSSSSLDDAQMHVGNALSLDEFMIDDERAVVKALQDSVDQRRKLIEAGEEVLTIDGGAFNAKALLTKATPISRNPWRQQQNMQNPLQGRSLLLRTQACPLGLIRLQWKTSPRLKALKTLLNRHFLRLIIQCIRSTWLLVKMQSRF
ncbi:hypothetical protein [Atopobium minutum]|uniref:hypothetical protein n=1 Tax=Atopobium minutum TaxID=1381 RepID=UPI00280AF127|nr:hypothetical protein [Atopobium minutum]